MWSNLPLLFMTNFAPHVEMDDNIQDYTINVYQIETQRKRTLILKNIRKSVTEANPITTF